MQDHPDDFHEYHDQNANEVNALVEVGAIDERTARRVIALLRERYESLRNMSVTDRVDLARDLATTIGGSRPK